MDGLAGVVDAAFTAGDEVNRTFGQMVTFSPPLTHFRAIFVALMFWNFIGFTSIFLVCGAVAACVFRRHWIALAIPIVAGLVGSISGVIAGVLMCLLSPHLSSLCFPPFPAHSSLCIHHTALVTATLYAYGGPFVMKTFPGFVWGLALPVLYTVVSLVKFALPA